MWLLQNNETYFPYGFVSEDLCVILFGNVEVWHNERGCQVLGFCDVWRGFLWSDAQLQHSE